MARCGSETPQKKLIISSGLHGVEGFLGSAIQLQAIKSFEPEVLEKFNIEVVLIHALNPFGFARIRRMDQLNFDLNRNFLSHGEHYEGCHEYYRKLDAFLNPKLWPKRELPAQLQAVGLAVRYGMKNLQQAIAEGQYDYPLGLFFGGQEPSECLKFTKAHLLEEFETVYMEQEREVLHLDVHSGLGKSGTFEYLIDYALSKDERLKLNELFDTELPSGTANSNYQAKGSINRWIRDISPATVSICWEFGTYHPILVLAALRAENAAYHWGERSSASFKKTKQNLFEAFCPASANWKSTVLKHAGQTLNRIVNHWNY